MNEIKPFRIDIPQAELTDLRDRLARTRLTAGQLPGWDRGVPADELTRLVKYWADGYDWRVHEARINDIPQFRTEIDGTNVHFLHVTSPEPGAFPLVLTHGWPGTFVEFLKVIGPLTDPGAHGGDPADAFHVVVPSLPGYGCSDKPTAPGWNVHRVARAWDELMGVLGYDRYGAQGGDWGAMVTTSLGQQRPERVAGIHLNMAAVGPDEPTFGDLTPTEQKVLEDLAEHANSGMGYSSQQSTRPQTLGYGLSDSPAGQCAWIAEKFWAWTDC